MATARTSSLGEIEMRAGGSGAIAVAQTTIKSTIPPWKTLRLFDARIGNAESVSGSLTGIGLNRQNAFG